MGRLFLIVSLALFYSVGSGYLSGLALDSLETTAHLEKPEWKNKNLIVVLGAGTIRWPQTPAAVTSHAWAYSRIFEAARLYTSCKKQSQACTILTSGGDPSENQLSEAEAMANALISIGVPESEIVLESKSRNTFQNAKFSAEILLPLNYDQIYLVTSGFHERRAAIFFEHFKVAAWSAPSDHLSVIHSVVPIAINFSFFDIALHEYFGLAQFNFYSMMGWN